MYVHIFIMNFLFVSRLHFSQLILDFDLLLPHLLLPVYLFSFNCTNLIRFSWSFVDIIKRRKNEAKRSILVQVKSQESAAELYSYCTSEIGSIKGKISLKLCYCTSVLYQQRSYSISRYILTSIPKKKSVSVCLRP